MNKSDEFCLVRLPHPIIEAYEKTQEINFEQLKNESHRAKIQYRVLTVLVFAMLLSLIAVGYAIDAASSLDQTQKTGVKFGCFVVGIILFFIINRKLTKLNLNKREYSNTLSQFRADLKTLTCKEDMSCIEDLLARHSLEDHFASLAKDVIEAEARVKKIRLDLTGDPASVSVVQSWLVNSQNFERAWTTSLTNFKGVIPGTKDDCFARAKNQYKKYFEEHGLEIT